MIFQDKLFYKIGEVAEITKLETYVLRYWETEFAALAPGKSKTGRRLYEKRDIEIVLKIKKLLYEEKFSIEGAKRKLEKKENKNTSVKFEETIRYCKKELQSLLDLLKDK